VKQVDFGGGHLLVLLQDGSVYSSGEGKEGQLGVGAKGMVMTKSGSSGSGSGSSSLPELVPVWPLKGIKVRNVSCGGHHSAAVTEEGDLYTWGRGFEG